MPLSGHFHSPLRSVFTALGGVLVVATVLTAVLQISYGWIGGGLPIWSAEAWGAAPDTLARWHGEDRRWWWLVLAAGLNSLPPFLMAWGGTLLVGYSWGLLGARWRRYRVLRWLQLPFVLMASVPAFWWPVMVAVYSFVVWDRPGFAHEVLVSEGPDLLGWWTWLVVALPAFAAGASWQIRSVATVMEKEAVRPYVKGLVLAGFPDDAIFYHHLLRASLGHLLRLSTGALPLIVALLTVAEWAFRYQGLGSLLLESIHYAYYPGILSVTLLLSLPWVVLQSLQPAVESSQDEEAGADLAHPALFFRAKSASRLKL